jgi:hypothetical protein
MFYPPTCVGLRYGRLELKRLEAFLGPHSGHFWLYGPPSGGRLDQRISLLVSTLPTFGTSIHSEADPRGRVPPSLLPAGTGVFTRCPSPTPLGLG